MAEEVVEVLRGPAQAVAAPGSVLGRQEDRIFPGAHPETPTNKKQE